MEEVIKTAKAEIAYIQACDYIQELANTTTTPVAAFLQVPMDLNPIEPVFKNAERVLERTTTRWSVRNKVNSAIHYFKMYQPEDKPADPQWANKARKAATLIDNYREMLRQS